MYILLSKFSQYLCSWWKHSIP